MDSAEFLRLSRAEQVGSIQEAVHRHGDELTAHQAKQVLG